MGRNLPIFLGTVILWDNLLQSFSTWTLMLSCRSVVSPWSFWSSTYSIFEFPRWRFNEPSTILFTRCFPVTRRHFVTSLLAANHCERSSRSCWRADVMPWSPFATSDEKLRVVSSAQMSTVELWAAKGRLLMNRRNMMGPRMLPCGTPAVTVLEEERHPSMTSHFLRPFRWLRSKSSSLPHIPETFSFVRRRPWSI